MKYKVVDNNDISKFTKTSYNYTKYINMFVGLHGCYYLPPSVGMFKQPTRPIVKSGGSFVLRDHQQQVIDFVSQQIQSQHRSCFVESATGTGKTYMLLGVCDLIGGRAIVVVPTKAIGNQIVETISQYYYCGWYKQGCDFDVAVVCYKSFNLLYDKIVDEFDVLLIDELHNLPNKRIKQIIMRKGSFIFGCTATPIRKEFAIEGFKMLLGGYFNTSVKTLPVRVFYIDSRITVPLDQYHQLLGGLPHESPEVYRRIIITNKDRNAMIVRLIKRLRSIGIYKIIFFSDRTYHLEELSLLLGQESILFYGKSDIVKAKQRALSLKKYVILGNIKTCGEGFDLPELQCGILGVSTARVKSIVQMVGRILRPSGNKTCAYFIDIFDRVKIGSSKYKPLAIYQRTKIYTQHNRPIEHISFLPSFIHNARNNKKKITTQSLF